MCDQKIQAFVDLTIKNLNLSYSNYKFSVDGNSSKGDGYIGIITFVTVTGVTQNGNQEVLNLVIKSAKESEKLRQAVPIKESFSKEIFIYNNVRAAFDSIQKAKKIEKLVKIMPSCYATQLTDKNEFLVFENLKAQGYDLWDRRIPMTMKHVQLVLDAYGQWHALSFALKDQQRETFSKLTNKNINVWSHILKNTNMINVFADAFHKAEQLVIEKNQNFKTLNFSNDDIHYFFTNMFFEEPDHHVILHGDCWNNNFMFKSLSDADVSKPSDVCIVDWQCSGLASPVFDLSHFIYCCCDTGRYTEVEELLKIYYNSLSDCLERLGSIPSETYPYKKLIEQWNKFSKFGLTLSPMMIRGCLCEDDSIPDLEEIAQEDKDISENFNFSNMNHEEYYERMKNNLQHYVKNSHLQIN